jgi:hypothetical protein
MRYAIVKNNVVVNVIEYESQPTTPPPGFDEGNQAIQADHVSIGWTYANGNFTDPNPPTQTTIEVKSLTEKFNAQLEINSELSKAIDVIGDEPSTTGIEASRLPKKSWEDMTALEKFRASKG